MTWDPERYTKEVLEPARKAGNVPPADLYVRYCLPAGISDERAFAARVDEVVSHWRTLESRRTYQRLAGALLAQHQNLSSSGVVTAARFGQQQADTRRAHAQRLAVLAKDEAGTATVVGPIVVARLRAAVGGAVPDVEVRAALTQAGVRVVEVLPELPAAQRPKTADLVRLTQQLSLRFSVEAVFADAVTVGFRVLPDFQLADRRRLTDEAISEARRQVDLRGTSDPTKTPTEDILAILRAAARDPAELNALLLSEVIERLRPLADGGFPQRAIANQAREFGLVEADAGVIAAAIQARDNVGAVRQQAEQELAAGRLRSAQRLVASLPADDPLRQRVAERDAEVALLVRRADQEQAAGRSEPTARLLADAVAIAGDDGQLSARLAAVPLPPPRNASARVSGNQVLITWEASPTATGQPVYRVVRNEGSAPATPAEGTVIAAATGQREAADPEAPPGAALFYSVFAARGGTNWSLPPSVTRSVIFAPEVAGVSVEAGATSVALSWRAHAGTDGVVAVRAEGRPPQGAQDGTPVEASLLGLTDTGLRTAAEYYYRITAAYRTASGQRRLSAGIVVQAVPTPAPEPVTRLDVRAGADGAGLVAAWVPPRHGQVRLMLADKPPRWAAGTALTVEQTAGLRPVPGTARRGPDGWDALELSLPPGRRYLVALTAGGSSVVMGETAMVGLAEPVSEVTALRLHDLVRLSWIWPADATDVIVRWPGGEHRCSRRVYDDEGGVAVSVGQAKTIIEARAVYAHPDGELIAPAVAVTVPGRKVSLNYRILPASRLRPRQRVIEVSAEQPVMLPALVVVRATGTYAPEEPAEGAELARIESQPIAPGQPVRVTVEPPKGRGWLACFVDPGGPGGQGPDVLLFPPPTEEMRIR